MKTTYSSGRYTLKQEEGNDSVYNVIDTQTNLIIGAFFAGRGGYRFHDRDSTIYVGGMEDLYMVGAQIEMEYEKENS